MPNASLSIDGTEVISKVSGTITQTFPGPNHTFTVKAENSPIAGANYNTSDNATSDQLAIYNGATKLWGINESGWIQQPNIPAFHAYPSSVTSAESVVSFNSTTLNNGNHFSTTTYSFTAPIDGIYHFYSMHNGNTGAPGVFYFRLNGTEVTSARGYANDNDESPSIHLTQNLYAGDKIDVYSQDSLAAAPYTNFGGYLIG